MVDCVGLIPAGGKATRMLGLPKFLLPAGGRHLLDRLETSMAMCGIQRRMVIASEATYPFVRGYARADSLRAIVRHETMTEALVKCRAYAGDSVVVMGMPDTWFSDVTVFRWMLAKLNTGADVTLGVFSARPEQRHKLGMVEIVGDDAVIRAVDKPEETVLTQAWGVMAWKPAFWDVLTVDMPHVGYGIMPAIEAGLDVRAARMAGGYWDCGTFDEYADLCVQLTSKRVMS